MKRGAQITIFVIGACLIGTAVDGWLEAACVSLGGILILTRIDYSPTFAERALHELVGIHSKLFVIRADLEREWLPLGGAESEAKRVIISEIHDLTPPFVREVMEKGDNK